MLQYIVQPGDSVYFIALKFNTSVKDIMETNMITDANSIYPGQVINIPLTSFSDSKNHKLPTLKRGSRGPFVMLLQSHLSHMGYYTGALDGVFDAITEGSIIQFQISRSLPPTGIMDFTTWNKLLEEERAIMQVPPFRAKMLLSGMLMILSVDRNTYAPGQRITMNLLKLNLSSSPITLHYNTGQRYDFKITYPSGRSLWRWSESKGFVQALGTVTLYPGQTVRYTEHFTFPQSQTPGLYQVFGWNQAKEIQHIKLAIPIHIKD